MEENDNDIISSAHMGHASGSYQGEDIRGACLVHSFFANSPTTNAAKAALDKLVPVFPSPTYPAMTSFDSEFVNNGTLAIVQISSCPFSPLIVSPIATTSL